MARPLGIECPGAVYHITSRGNAREAIALADDDREDFIQVLGTVVERYRWRCHAYCLMTNHYHLPIETPTAKLDSARRVPGAPKPPPHPERTPLVSDCSVTALRLAPVATRA